ncbi:DNA primase [Pelagibacteraceae bacterium]|nr:DNA primase [Pelagibacteraceae bacterium]MDB9743282.1 DNA primase [Pelagibacteraceae bacterium]MDC0366706.1 DNA primase [Pelagibacteraceae bacterium]
MKYPKEYLDEIKLRLKVSQVVGKSVQLKKRGKEFVGLSPFKNEKSPSFTVNDEKEFYHCFSSSEHGNIFDFLMKTKSIGFGEAVRELASQAGMQPYRFSNFDKKKDLRFQTYKNIYKEYSDHFHKELFNPNNKEALDYLKMRGLNSNIIKEFKLGYVPWKNNFYEELLKNNSKENISLTGLYYINDKSGKYIDRFNSRIIFPVNNITGDTIALGGRIIKESKLAKYINSPETEFYKKGSMIFNLDKAKDCRSTTNEVIIVEGYMDVVSLYSSGIKNVIANSGTALTDRQIDIIWKFFSNPIICLDGDQSGQNAALRIAEKLLPLINEEGKIYFSIMPEGKDPDDYIKENGKENFISFIKDKQIIQTYIWNYHLQKIDRNNPFEVSRFEKEIKKLCYLIKDETLKKYVLEDFLEKIKKLTPIQNTRRNFQHFQKYNKKQDYQLLNETKTLHKKNNHFSKIQIKEFSILFIMLNYLDIASKKIENISEITFFSEKNENLKKLIIDLLLKGNNKDAVQEKISINYNKLVEEIHENSSIQIILKTKNEEGVLELLDELLLELKELSDLKKIESLEKELINNLDENSYSELIKLKSQLNRE